MAVGFLWGDKRTPTPGGSLSKGLGMEAGKADGKSVRPVLLGRDP